MFSASAAGPVKAERSEPKGSLDTEKKPSKIQKKLV
jgi:hypothetical protein